MLNPDFNIRNFRNAHVPYSGLDVRGKFRNRELVETDFKCDFVYHFEFSIYVIKFPHHLKLHLELP